MDDYISNASVGDYYSCEVPGNGFELQPSETCPKNFIIFDQTENKSLIMFHPTLAQKFSYPNFDFGSTYGHVCGINQVRYTDNQDKASSSFKDDSDDIDALLSLEDENDDEDEDDDDDVVSTGRTPGDNGSTCPDSLQSGDGSVPHRLKFRPQSSTSNAVGGRKKERMRKMVKTLRGIIPGGDQMDTPAILDEAVRYLKSLKVEVKKLQNLKK